MSRTEDVTERLYGLLPAYIATEDAAQGYPLKALFTLLAAGSAEIDAEIDKLYDSMFVETASETALTDIAALVAAEALRPLPFESGYSPRAFVGNTMRYRRGKGTARVLEALAADVGGVGAIAVEYFMRLARTQSLIHVRPERPGTADLRAGSTAARAGTAFDRLPRLADVRSIARAGGRGHVPNVGVHILRPLAPVFEQPDGIGPFAAELVVGVPMARGWPASDGTLPAGYFQLAAQPGKPLRLFNPDRRDAATGRPTERDLPGRLPRLPLHLETEELRRAGLEQRAANLEAPPWFTPQGEPFSVFLRRANATTFEHVSPQQIVICNLDKMPANPNRPASEKAYSWSEGARPAALARTGSQTIRCGLDPQTGRLIVAQPKAGEGDVVEVRVAYATGIARETGAGPHNRDASGIPADIVDTSKLINRVWVVGGTDPQSNASVVNAPSLAAALSGWKAVAASGTRGFIVLTRCDIETAANSQFVVDVPVGTELHIVSASWAGERQRPGVQSNPARLGYIARQARRFVVDGQLRINNNASSGGTLVLNGIEVTGGVLLAKNAVSRLHIRHCTVRAPGGPAAIATTVPIVGASVEIERSIIGRVNLERGGPATGSLTIDGSIVSTDDASGPGATIALLATSFSACVRNTTILGGASFQSLEATNVIFSAAAEVVRSQIGCVSYSYIAPGSKTPRRFRCQPDLALAAARDRKGGDLDPQEQDTVRLGIAPVLLDSSIDEPTVAMLHPLCPDAIRLGGENDAEMGVFSAGAEGLRIANLTDLFDDYVPFGLEAGVIDDTRSSAVATRRNRP